jgi:hypothetical protein
VQRFVHDYDPGAEMLLTESFPPTGHVIVKTNTPDFCGKIETLLETPEVTEVFLVGEKSPEWVDMA